LCKKIAELVVRRKKDTQCTYSAGTFEAGDIPQFGNVASMWVNRSAGRKKNKFREFRRICGQTRQNSRKLKITPHGGQSRGINS
jgi:hypothetical protein